MNNSIVHTFFEGIFRDRLQFSRRFLFDTERIPRIGDLCFGNRKKVTECHILRIRFDDIGSVFGLKFAQKDGFVKRKFSYFGTSPAATHLMQKASTKTWQTDA